MKIRTTLPALLMLETRLLLRQPWIWMAILAFTAIACWGVQQGKYVHAFHQGATDSLQASSIAKQADIKKKLDSTDYSTGGRTALETPFTLENQLRQVAYRPAHPLMVLSVGQNDLLAFNKAARINMPVFANEYDEFKNPNQLLAGAFDLTFFLLYLFPLLLIALVYNLPGWEKEQGIWSQWTATLGNTATSWQLIRLSFRWLLATLPMVVALLTALPYLQQHPTHSSSEWWQWVAWAWVYMLLWLALCAGIQYIQKSSLVQVMLLMGTWVCMLLVIPGMVNTIYNQKNPNTLRLDIAQFRDVPQEAWEAPMQEHRSRFAGRYPAHAQDTGTEAEIYIKVYGYLAATIEAEEKLFYQYKHNLQQQLQNETAIGWLNPAGKFYTILTRLAQADQHTQLQFEEALLQFRKEKFNYLMDNLVLEKRFTPAHLLKMPLWQFVPQK